MSRICLAAVFPFLFSASFAAEQPESSAFENFIVSSGAAYGLEQLPGKGPLLLGGGGAVTVVSSEGRERIAEHAAFLSGPDAPVREFEKLKSLLSSRKMWSEDTEKLVSDAARALNPEGKNILMHLLAGNAGKAELSLRNRLASAPGTTAKNAGTGNKAQAALEWKTVDEAARTGNFETLSGFSFDRNTGTIRIMVAGKRPHGQDILTGQDVTPAKEKEILVAAGLPKNVAEECGGRLVRVIGNTLFYDVPLGKARHFAENCARAGLPVRPVLIFRAK